MMKRKINQKKKRACKYAYSVTYFNIHNKKHFLTFRGNEGWWDPWGHEKKKATEDEEQ